MVYRLLITSVMTADKIIRLYFMKKSFHLMVDDGKKSALLFLNYNIGASGREEYKENKKR